MPQQHLLSIKVDGMQSIWTKGTAARVKPAGAFTFLHTTCLAGKIKLAKWIIEQVPSNTVYESVNFTFSR